MKAKVTIVGAGNVGATAAQRIYESGIADVVLLDVVDGLPQGKALDMLESGPVLGVDADVIGTNDYADTIGSDIVVITAGIARKPGMSRDDLLATNMNIVGEVTRQVVKFSPDCTLIVVSNPLDAMVQHASDVCKFPRERIIGMAGILDTARFRTFLAKELKVSSSNISAYVLGGHGDLMVPLIGSTTVAGIPVAQLIEKDRLQAIVDRTRDGGAEIVRYLKTGSAYYAPSAAVAEMVESILLDRKKILPCAAKLSGEYGYSEVFAGVPVKLGISGMEKVLEIELNEEEKVSFGRSVDAVKGLMRDMKKLQKA